MIDEQTADMPEPPGMEGQVDGTGFNRNQDMQEPCKLKGGRKRSMQSTRGEGRSEGREVVVLFVMVYIYASMLD